MSKNNDKVWWQKNVGSIVLPQNFAIKNAMKVLPTEFIPVHIESKDIHMLQRLNPSVQGCMNKMWIILLIVKETVIGGIHTFLKSYADNTISIFSLLSFSAWDVAHEGEKLKLFSQRKT